MQVTLSQKVYEHLRRKLSRGELAAGERLVNRALADEIGVSLTPVREAINRLASEGLVEYVRGAGAFVTAPDRSELAQLYDLRETFEPYASSEAARNISGYELEELFAVCDDWLQICRELRDADPPHATAAQMNRWLDNEERFHALLINGTRNRWLTKIATDVRLATVSFVRHRQMPTFLDLHNAAVTWRDHLRLARAVRDSDAELARELTRQQIVRGRELVLAFIDASREETRRESEKDGTE